MPVNSISVPHPADPDGTHDTRYLQLTDPDVHVPVTVTDTASVNLTLTGQDVTADVLPAGVAHQSLSGAGTNTHAQLDTATTNSVAHIAATSAHGSSGNVVGATTLASDIATHAASTISHGSNGAIVGATTLAASIATHASVTSTHGSSGAIVGATTLAADIATHAAVTATHGATGAVVGTTNTQSLLNKTIASPVITGTTTGSYTIGGTPTFPSTVVLTTGAQTLASKTLTGPTIGAAEWSTATHSHVGTSSGGTISHTALTAIGTNSHTTIDTHIASITDHGMAGGVVGSGNFNITSTTPATITGHSFAIGANEVWSYEFVAITFMSSGTGGLKFNTSGPSGAAATTVFEGDTTALGTKAFSKVAISVASTAFGAYGGANAFVRGSGSITNVATPGTFAIQCALATGGNIGTLEAYITHMTAKRIA